MTQPTTLQSQFKSLGACQDAIKMAKEYKTLEEAWNAWPRGDHMLWIYRRAKNYDFQLLTLAKGHCANTVRHLMKYKRSTDAVDMAIKFGEGNATLAEVNAAAAYAAYAADAADYAAYAADAAAYAAYAAADDAADAYAATYAAYAAADDAADAYAATYAAYAATYAADAANRAEARKKNQQATADICRKYLPLPIL
jgi:hypothetical protein